MNIDLLAAIVISVIVVVAGLLAIRHWGPGRYREWVRCPEHKVEAQILIERREGSFASLTPPDVVACSLLPEGKVDCEKKCLQL